MSHFDSPSHSLRRGTVSQISQSFLLGDDLARLSEGNAVFSCWDVDEPAFSLCVGESRRERRAMQRHLSHGYLVYPSAGHWRARICSCGD
jgi:hypothetical protein